MQIHKEISKQRSAKTASNIGGKTMPSQSPTVVQAQLETTTPGDTYEQEADRMADMVMRKIDGANTSEATPSNHCPTPTISCFGGTSIPISSQMESQLQSMQGGGHAMPDGLRAQMENSFGHDFSNVRLHTDSAAADMSRSINAKAFTHGNDIYFNQGQFQPNTPAGQHLIAHELTHTVQQGGKVAREEGEENNLVDKIIKSGVFNEEDEEIKASNTITLFILIQILEKGNTPQENIGDIEKLKDYLNGQIINEYYDNLIESNTIETLIEFIKEIYSKNSNNCNYTYYKTTSDWEYQITNLSRDDFNSYKENALLSYQRNFVKNNINDFEWEEQNKMIPILSYNNRHVKTSDMYFHKNGITVAIIIDKDADHNKAFNEIDYQDLMESKSFIPIQVKTIDECIEKLEKTCIKYGPLKNLVLSGHGNWHGMKLSKEAILTIDPEKGDVNKTYLFMRTVNDLMSQARSQYNIEHQTVYLNSCATDTHVHDNAMCRMSFAETFRSIVGSSVITIANRAESYKNNKITIDKDTDTLDVVSKNKEEEGTFRIKKYNDFKFFNAKDGSVLGGARAIADQWFDKFDSDDFKTKEIITSIKKLKKILVKNKKLPADYGNNITSEVFIKYFDKIIKYTKSTKYKSYENTFKNLLLINMLYNVDLLMRQENINDSTYDMLIEEAIMTTIKNLTGESACYKH